ncbi:beta-N-acetylhexosaminidase [Photobacterium sp. 1_MG-2023]|uniref:beta-N-acetylhexosaminidase n=1 Tax=Photobacterium sp. 1_MG-2023 TaxID=3062646 RepID=UPI0026E2B773|nr:family 20 glycosylhydrolase [Photobacterium sp. 1_MG-2023]MDO6704847.1 family 20 glycosylhydrolase [Photobacterium sp. 1_MG-2023]
MSYRLDFTVLHQTETETRLSLTLHNLSDQSLEAWSLAFILSRWIEPATVSHGHLKQNGSYCTLAAHPQSALQANGHFYTEFAIKTPPLTLHSDGIAEACLYTATSEKPLPVVVTPLNLKQPAQERNHLDLPPAKAINLIPAPAALQERQGEFRWSRYTALASVPDAATGSVRWLQQTLASWLDTPLTVEPQGQIHYQLKPELAEGAYHLLIEAEAIWLEASSAAGFSHATASLLQLLPTQPVHQVEHQITLPMVDIQDQPQYGHRGMMLDCARHFHPVTRIKRLLDQLARLKFNTFHWHLTDDEGWRIEIDAYPALTQIGAWRGPEEALIPQFSTIDRRHGGFYSKQDIRDIVAYAADRSIQVIPEIDIPGHCRAAIKSLPELLVDPEDHSSYRSIQNYSDNVLSPALEGTYTFLTTVLDEVCDLFPAPFLHVGADEVPHGVWTDSPACRKMMDEHGYTDPMELQGHLLRFVENYLSQKGKRMLGWQEVVKGDKVSKNTIVLPWMNEQAGLDCAGNGYEVIMQPAQFTYLDLAQSACAEEPGANWAGFLPLETVYSYRPLAALEPSDPKLKQILGIQCGLWCEHVFSQSRFEYLLFPRLMAISEVCWCSPEQRHWDDFLARLHGQLAYLDRMGINYRPC